MIARLALFGAMGLLLLGVTGAALLSSYLAPVAAAGSPVHFVVSPGESLGTVVARLESQGLVRDARVAGWWARWQGLAGSLQVGEYAISPASSVAEILEQIARGDVLDYEVSIPEGLTAAEIGRRISEAGLVDEDAFAEAVGDPELAAELGIPATHLEGYLLPETYRMPKGLGAREVATLLVEHFMEVWSGLAPAAASRGLSMHEVVILASIVEKETGAAPERPLIASVFHNRLARSMRLESDPTIIYGIPEFDGNLRRRDLDNAANLYNTYQHAGLPPGPIASPGVAALRAVVEPAESDYLFFVSKGDGTHHFSKSYREHARMVDRYQRRRGRP